MAKEGKYDHLIIESTGISDPAPVAEALVESDSSTNDTGYFFDDEDDDDDDDEEGTGSVATLVGGAVNNARRNILPGHFSALNARLSRFRYENPLLLVSGLRKR